MDKHLKDMIRTLLLENKRLKDENAILELELRYSDFVRGQDEQK